MCCYFKDVAVVYTIYTRILRHIGFLLRILSKGAEKNTAVGVFADDGVETKDLSLGLAYKNTHDDLARCKVNPLNMNT